MNAGRDARNSTNDPLRIAELSVPSMLGVIGMTICPGKKGPSIYGKPWDRDLETDLELIRYEWRANVMMTLLEAHEFEMLGVEALQDLASTTLGPQWIHLEITDGDIPDARFERQWPLVRAQLIGTLSAGGKVLVHCRGGLGRTGLVVARLLVETGLLADKAIALVRSVRDGAIETAAQEQYVRSIAPSLPVSLRHGLTLPLSELLTAECTVQDKVRTSELALTVFVMLMARWSALSPEFNIKRAGAALLGISETAFAEFISGENQAIADTVLHRIDCLSRIALSLSTLFEGDLHREVEWLEVPRNGNDALIAVMDYTTPLEYLKTKGDAAFVFISDYLRQRAETLKNNDRYLLCLDVQNTLLNTTDIASITASLRKEPGIENLTETANHAFEKIKSLPITVVDDQNQLIIKRPYLDDFLDFVDSQPNLDVAIISWDGRSHIVNCLEKAAPALLERCKFIWTSEDQSKYWKRLCNGDLRKGLHNIPELHGYKRGKILMLQKSLGLFKNGILPEESQVTICAFRMHTLNPAYITEDCRLLDVIKTIRHLIQQADIIAHIRETECIESDDPCFKPATKELLARISEAVANFDVDLITPLSEDDE